MIDTDSLLRDIEYARKLTGTYDADTADGYYPAMSRIFEALEELLQEKKTADGRTEDGPWDAAPDMLQAMWDTGEARNGESEWSVCKYDDGTLMLQWVESPRSANPQRRFGPRRRPSWQDAEVVEASTDDDSERRRFLRVSTGGWVDEHLTAYHAGELIGPEPMTVQKKDE